ncbi:SDR family NAD(P)-dependent oxidoreductase [Plesiomonas shigelloides subsp. oncorhynchi]|nr:SDR family NAD(P)-dependent oxidoreductase [Plesiomonas shigelloides]
MQYQNHVQYYSIKDKVTVITGGASGIGEELVRAYVSQGAKVAFLDFDRVAGENWPASSVVCSCSAM